MNNFFDLPEDQQRIVLSQWLDLKELAIFDSAVCSQKYRSEFLTLIQSPLCVFHSFTTSHAVLADQWIVKRSLHFLELVFCGTTDPLARDAVLQMSAKTVQILTIHTFTALQNSSYMESITPSQYDTDGLLADVLELIASCCTELREFTLLGGDNLDTGGFRMHSWDPFIRMIQANKALSLLCVGHGLEIDIRVLEAVYLAPQLTELNLWFCTFTAPVSGLPATVVSTSIDNLEYWGYENFPMVDLCRRLPSLTALRGGSADTHEETIKLFSCCPLLSNLELISEDPLSDEEIHTMVQSWPRLTRLTLQLANKHGSVCSEPALLHIIRNYPLIEYINVCDSGCDKMDCPFDTNRKYANGAEWDEIEDEKCDLRSDITGEGSHLQILRVDSLSEHGLRTITEQCKHLKVLAILHARPEISLIDLDAPEPLRPAETALHHLVNSSVDTLHLQNYLSLRDEDLLPLSNLEELCINRTGVGVTNAGIVSLAARCGKLHTLCIVSMAGVTHECILPVLEACPTMEGLEYYGTNATHILEDSAFVLLKQTIRKQFSGLKMLELHF